MFEISRRDLVLGSTGAALVFGLKGPVSFIGAAHAQKAADSLKYKIGDIEVFSLHEGSIERQVTEGMVKNVGLDDVKKALTASGHRSRQDPESLHRHRHQDQRQGHPFRHRFWRQRPGVGRQARRQHEGGGP